ncbi:hypothetical protein P389DRAFT_47291 [Cystobasidium minutum MCA 4210]|uniref:uncharacterized protein n=1 Tax=Cystobasidium minutum MCA 4210 TaxID=1397322 RepID=UPI0034CDB8A3|eukprot:jgi/Rhomi1/47291/CE47290_2288
MLLPVIGHKRVTALFVSMFRTAGLPSVVFHGQKGRSCSCSIPLCSRESCGKREQAVTYLSSIRIRSDNSTRTYLDSGIIYYSQRYQVPTST